MKRIIIGFLGLLMVLSAAWAQTASLQEWNLYEPAQMQTKTVAALLYGTADYAIFYVAPAVLSGNFAIACKFDTAYTAASFADSLRLIVCPRVRNDGVEEPDGRELKTLWADSVLCTLASTGVDINLWAPAAGAMRTFVPNLNMWRGAPYDGFTFLLRNQGHADSAKVTQAIFLGQ